MIHNPLVKGHLRNIPQITNGTQPENQNFYVRIEKKKRTTPMTHVPYRKTLALNHNILTQ